MDALQRGPASQTGLKTENLQGGVRLKAAVGVGLVGVVTGQRGVAGQSFQVPRRPVSVYESGTGGALEPGGAARRRHRKPRPQSPAFNPPGYFIADGSPVVLSERSKYVFACRLQGPTISRSDRR